jgi:hypothetical protein
MAFRQNGGSSTCVVEPVELQDVSHFLQQPADAKLTGSRSSLQIHEARHIEKNDDPVENLPSPTTAGPEKLERWNSPKVNMWRTFAAFWSFVVMGSNDAAYGVSRTDVN